MTITIGILHSKINPREERKMCQNTDNHFDKTRFLSNWKVVKNEIDINSVPLTSSDLNRVKFITALKEDEDPITGTENIKRLKENGYTCFNDKIFFELWENTYCLGKSWMDILNDSVNGHVRFIFFDGTIFEHPIIGISTLYVYWYDNKLQYSAYKLNRNRPIGSLTAVLKT